jgi:hypothetical protein
VAGGLVHPAEGAAMRVRPCGYRVVRLHYPVLSVLPLSESMGVDEGERISQAAIILYATRLFSVAPYGSQQGARLRRAPCQHASAFQGSLV